MCCEYYRTIQRYIMITSFYDQISEDIFDGKNNKNTQKRWPSSLHKAAKRKLDIINAAVKLKDLEAPPGNRLEKLKEDRKHQHSRLSLGKKLCYYQNIEDQHILGRSF